MSDDLRDIHRREQQEAMQQEARKVHEQFIQEIVKATTAHFERRRRMERQLRMMVVFVVGVASLSILLPALALAWRWFNLK